MPNVNKTKTIEENDWTLRIYEPETGPVIGNLLLLHGWTGDENSMWVFVANLSDQFRVIAPRGIFRTQPKGYAWRDEVQSRRPTYLEFEESAARILQAWPAWFPEKQTPYGNILMGFSQGTALSYTLLTKAPALFNKAILMAGFVPQGAPEPTSLVGLKGRRAYIAHGSQDEVIPIEEAHNGFHYLQTAGMDVQLCETESGHKLGLSCLKNIQAFLDNTD